MLFSQKSAPAPPETEAQYWERVRKARLEHEADARWTGAIAAAATRVVVKTSRAEWSRMRTARIADHAQQAKTAMSPERAAAVANLQVGTSPEYWAALRTARIADMQAATEVRSPFATATERVYQAVEAFGAEPEVNSDKSEPRTHQRTLETVDPQTGHAHTTIVYGYHYTGGYFSPREIHVVSKTGAVRALSPSGFTNEDGAQSLGAFESYGRSIAALGESAKEDEKASE